MNYQEFYKNYTGPDNGYAYEDWCGQCPECKEWIGDTKGWTGLFVCRKCVNHLEEIQERLEKAD